MTDDPDTTAQRAEDLDAAARHSIDEGDFAAARAAFEALLALQQEQHDTAGTVLQMIHVAWVLRMGQQDYGAARRLLDAALALAADLPVGDAVRAHLADLALDEGDARRAQILVQSLLGNWEAAFPVDVGFTLETLACAVATLGDARRAATLFGAVDALRAQYTMPHTLPVVLSRYKRLLAPAQTSLSGEEWSAAWSQGQALSLAEAVADALGRRGGT